MNALARLVNAGQSRAWRISLRNQRGAGAEGDGASVEEAGGGVRGDAAGGDEMRSMGERGEEGLDVGGATDFGREELHEIRPALVGEEAFRRSEGAAGDGFLELIGDGDDFGLGDGGDDEFGAGIPRRRAR